MNRFLDIKVFKTRRSLVSTIAQEFYAYVFSAGAVRGQSGSEPTPLSLRNGTAMPTFAGARENCCNPGDIEWKLYMTECKLKP